MISDDIFYEAPQLKTQFNKWFENRSSRIYNIDMMPEFMALPIVIKWLDTRGLYIQREVENHRAVIWDYRDSEPEECIIVDCEYSESNEEWLMDAIKVCVRMLF